MPIQISDMLVFEAVEPLDGYMAKVSVFGTGFVDGERDLLAMIGNQIIENVYLAGEDFGFTGLLPEMPAVGDRLQVGYNYAELEDMGVSYAEPLGPSV